MTKSSTEKITEYVSYKKQYRKNHRICLIVVVTLAIVLMVHMVTTIRGKQEEQTSTEITPDIETLGEQMSQAQQMQEVQHESVDEAAGEEQTSDRYAVFDTMSEDWGTDDIEGFTYFEIPERYAENGGYFPEKMQIYTYCVCQQYGVRYSLVVALIEHESGYRFDEVGDGGNSKGYMQIYESCHTDRMEELGCDDLLNPYQNVRVGIDYLEGLIEKYGTMQDALAAYNYGERGAYQHLWSNGIYVYDYNSEIMSRMKEIEEEWRNEIDRDN